MAFESMYLEEDIHIDRIYTIHYFEYKSDFHFAGERHNFWEFQCVDKGKAEIETDNGIYHLTSGQPPKIPSSSQIIEKIMSFCASGTLPSF